VHELIHLLPAALHHQRGSPQAEALLARIFDTLQVHPHGELAWIRDAPFDSPLNKEAREWWLEFADDLVRSQLLVILVVDFLFSTSANATNFSYVTFSICSCDYLCEHRCMHLIITPQQQQFLLPPCTGGALRISARSQSDSSGGARDDHGPRGRGDGSSSGDRRFSLEGSPRRQPEVSDHGQAPGRLLRLHAQSKGLFG